MSFVLRWPCRLVCDHGVQSSDVNIGGDFRFDNIVWQTAGQSVAGCIDTGARTEAPNHFHHVVNLFRSGGDTDLGVVQTRTIDSMRNARRYATENSDVAIEFVSVHEPHDAAFVPVDFLTARALDRTIRDLPGFADGPAFPLVFDILESAGDVCGDSDGHVIFTNSDICLQPVFYAAVGEALAAGFDSLIINRRTIDSAAIELPYELAAAELGEIHPGLDCFIFPCSWLQRFQRNDACVGAPQVMRSLFHNLVALADRLLILTEANLTFHYGDDRPWLSDQFAAHRIHNKEQTRQQIERLCLEPIARQRIERLHELYPKFKPGPATTAASASSEVAEGFSSARYQRINEARLAHLASLAMDLEGRSVLELGAGPGDLTGFFVDRGCTITSVDARPENIDELTTRHPSVEGLVIDLDAPLEPLGRQFQVVFIYGLIYHLGNPGALLRWAAEHCSQLALVSTCVSPGQGEELNPVAENAATGTQSASGKASRPTRGWVLAELNRHFAHAGICRTQPDHFEFPTDWDNAPTAESQNANGLCRAIFIGSNLAIDERVFSPTILRHQEQRDG